MDKYKREAREIAANIFRTWAADNWEFNEVLCSKIAEALRKRDRLHAEEQVIDMLLQKLRTRIREGDDD